MESSPHLFTESFSYSWLMNVNGDGGSSAFTDVDDPEIFSKRWNAADSLDFDFHLPAEQHPDGALVHADQLIADGLLLPLHLVRLPPEISLAESKPAATESVLLRSVSADSSKSLFSRSDRLRSCCAAAPRRATSSPSSSTSTLCAVLPSWRLRSARSSSSWNEKKVFRYLCSVLLPLYKRVKELVRKRRATRSAAAETSGSSSRRGDAIYFSGGVMVDAGAERAIYDAVLHCKNSFRKL